MSEPFRNSGGFNCFNVLQVSKSGAFEFSQESATSTTEGSGFKMDDVLLFTHSHRRFYQASSRMTVKASLKQPQP